MRITVEDAIYELCTEHIHLVEAVANIMGWGMGDAAEAIASHIVTTDMDFVIEDRSELKVITRKA